MGDFFVQSKALEDKDLLHLDHPILRHEREGDFEVTLFGLFALFSAVSVLDLYVLNVVVFR